MIVFLTPSAIHCPAPSAPHASCRLSSPIVKVVDAPSDGLIPNQGPLAPGEAIPPEEAAATKVVVDQLAGQVRDAAKADPPARRDQHPKTHGCVKTNLQVLDGLPSYLRVGLFATPHRYQAWIRFSNGSPTMQPDSVADVRGMAIKVMGVPESASTTQDFVMINGPAFFVHDAVDYIAFANAKPQWRFFLPSWNPFAIRFREFLNARAMVTQKVADPLQVRYWSTLPFLFGDTAFKFSVRPTGPEPALTTSDSPDYLRENMSRHLAAEDAMFDILVQLRSDPGSEPIEDPRVAWSADTSPFVRTARITIPAQSFEAPDQRTFCENLSFTPWHGVAAFRPLGGVNRVRRTAYETISKLRHDLNAAPREEPKGF